MNQINRITITGDIIASDINMDLINLFIDVRDNLPTLIQEITKLATEYSALSSVRDKKKYYYQQRDTYNQEECSIQKSPPYSYF